MNMTPELWAKLTAPNYIKTLHRLAYRAREPSLSDLVDMGGLIRPDELLALIRFAAKGADLVQAMLVLGPGGGFE